MSTSLEIEVEAIVNSIEGKGSRRFVVVYPTNTLLLPPGDTITFSLSIWEGRDDPRKDQMVMLANVAKFAKGWRAQKARPILLQAQN